MKRKIAVFIVVFVVAISSVVIADSVNIDLSSMSLDELVALKNDIAAEIYSRLGDDEPFASGMYVAGKDIKPGSYTLTNLTANDTANVAVLAAGSSINDPDPEIVLKGQIIAGGSFNINLEEDMTLVLELKTGMLSIRKNSSTSWGIE